MTDPDAVLSYRRLMVPVDMRHRENSAKSIETAAALAASSGGELLLMTAANPLGKHLTDSPESDEKAFGSWVEELSQRYGRPITAIFRSHESPEWAILQECRERGVDLVVMASHDPRLADHIFGSHASHIVRHAPCSVLVMR